MKKSIFKDWSICYWVDYSNRDDCETVEEITQEQYIEETKPVIVEETPVETVEEIEQSEEEISE